MDITIAADTIRPFIQGFLLCASIIMVLGPQNLFVLRQGIQRRHLFTTALICTLVDLVLIALSVGGVGTLVAAQRTLLTAVTTAGALFLVWCGVRSLLSASCKPTAPVISVGLASPLNLQSTVLAALGFSLLNPGVYVDTLVIIGTQSALIPFEQRMLFGLGAVLASACWFFTLAYGASRLSPFFRHPAVGRTLDVVSGVIMVGLGGTMFGIGGLPF